MTLPNLRLSHEFLVSKSCDRRPSTVVVQVLRARWRSGSIARLQPNFAPAASMLCSKTRGFSAGVCRFRRSRGFRIFSIAGCRSCFRRPPDGAAISAFAPRSHRGRRIMLSSESALRDCRKFYPGLTNDISVVRFATQPAPDSADRRSARCHRAIRLAAKIFLSAEPVLAAQESSGRGRRAGDIEKTRPRCCRRGLRQQGRSPRTRLFRRPDAGRSKIAVLKKIFVISE